MARTNQRRVPPKTKNNPDAKPRQHEAVEKEISAGGVVYRKTQNGIQIAFMLDSYDKWTFPKGHVESKEAFEEAAARETLEELGLEEICFIDDLGKISIWFRDQFQKKGHLIHKDIYYFLFETPAHANLIPDSIQHAYGAKWVSLKKAPEVSDYADLIPIIRRAIEKLTKK